MTKLRAAFSASAAGALFLLGSVASGTPVDFSITGTQSLTDYGCADPIPGTSTLDCSYNASDPWVPAGTRTWAGPARGGAYYPPGTLTAPTDIEDDPVPGDGKAALGLSGTITLDDPDGDPDCSGNENITATFQLAAGQRDFSGGQGKRALSEWTQIDYVLAEADVDSANMVDGNCVYIIGSEGFPPRLRRASDGEEDYPSEQPGGFTTDPTTPTDYWEAPSPIAMGSFENPDNSPVPGSGAPGNIGTPMTASPAGYTCAKNSTPGSDPCDGSSYKPVEGTRDVFENTLVQLVVTPSGDLAEGSAIYPVNEYSVFGLGLDPYASWEGVRWDFTGCSGCLPTANDDTVVVTTNQPADISSILDNDTNLVEPITVTAGDGASGTTAVTGSPGAVLDIGITFTTATEGADSFTYTITSGGATSAPATVTVDAQANIAAAATTSNPPAATGVAGDAADAITISADFESDLGGELGNAGQLIFGDSDPAGATAELDGTTVNVSFSTAAGGTYTIPYTLTDVGDALVNGSIEVEIEDVAPAITTATVSGSIGENDSSTTIDVTSAVTLGNGDIDDHEFAVSQQPAGGSASFGSPIATYTPGQSFIDSGGGEDCFNYTVTDADDDVQTGEICVDVAGASSGGGTSGPSNPGGASLSGGSALGPWALLMLLGLPFIRRRRVI